MINFKTAAAGITVAACLVLAGCGKDESKPNDGYVVDTDTGLCFAVDTGYQNFSRTWVPCTDKVLALVPPDERPYADRSAGLMILAR